MGEGTKWSKARDEHVRMDSSELQPFSALKVGKITEVKAKKGSEQMRPHEKVASQEDISEEKVASQEDISEEKVA